MLEELDALGSWKLEHLSSNTYIGDIVVTHEKRKDYGPAEVEAITALMKEGKCYRCRIGRLRWYYASTAEAAMKAAIEGAKK